MPKIHHARASCLRPASVELGYVPTSHHLCSLGQYVCADCQGKSKNVKKAVVSLQHLLEICGTNRLVADPW